MLLMGISSVLMFKNLCVVSIHENAMYFFFFTHGIILLLS